MEKEKLEKIAPFERVFGGNTGGSLASSEKEEKHLIFWLKEKGSEFFKLLDLPTGGAYFMQDGQNLIYFPRKEQCLALGKQLRVSFGIQDFLIYRLFSSGEIQFLHPKDGVFPEKVKAGRLAVGLQAFSGKKQ